MTASADYRASLTELTYRQLLDALTASKDEYELRFAAFLGFTETAHDAAQAGTTDAIAEATAAMTSAWAACKEQSAMTGALTAEITERNRNRNYA